MAPRAEAPPPREAGVEPEAALADALARARRHARNALAEALEVARALLDAASLASSGAASSAHPLFAGADGWIRRASEGLAESGALADDVAGALAEALDAEIARWEQRARVDDDARAVLRAFLGLRELLWEVGVRPARAARRDPAPAPAPERSRQRRVERVAVRT